MITFEIRLNCQQKVVNFVNAVSKYDFDIDACIGHYIIDAKSILGMLGLGVNKKILIQAHTEDDTFIAKDLIQYLASCNAA